MVFLNFHYKSFLANLMAQNRYSTKQKKLSETAFAKP